MDKVKCYTCAMLSVMQDEGLGDIEKLEVLEVLMEARNLEREATAWANYQADKEAQQG